MDAQVDERAAGREILVAEPAAGRAVAAQVGRFGVVNVPEIAVVHEILEDGAVVAVAADKADHQELSALLGGGEHFPRLSGGGGHRLLAEDVLAGLQGGDGAGRVGGVPGADADRVDFGQLGEHDVLVGVEAGDAILFTHLLEALFADVAEGVQLDVRVFQIALDVGFGDVADADDGNFDLLVHIGPSFLQITGFLS